MSSTTLPLILPLVSSTRIKIEEQQPLHPMPQSFSRVMSLTSRAQTVNRLINLFVHYFLRLLWHFLHLLVSLWYLQVRLVETTESYLISTGLLKDYKALDISSVQYLAIVIDSEDACQISKVLKLLKWLAAVGVKRLCLYDSIGILKTYKQIILEKLNNAVLFEELVEKGLPMDPEKMSLEFASKSDGKEAIAQAANLLFMRHLKLSKSDVEQKEPVFTEPEMDLALKALGYRGPEPDLMLVYGPVRCHLGFSPWRLRYTEIAHMGPLKSMKYGSLIKAIYKFTTVRQNYGS